jgi:uncharacterized protein (DUF2252 family)
MRGITDVAGELARLDAAFEARRPELIRQKRERMAAGAVPFFRATAALFFERLREELEPPRPPELEALARWLGGDASTAAARIAWCAGDVHVENFGGYRAAADGALRFGLNDFDDALPAPVELDALRLASSTLLVARAGGAAPREATALARALLERYAGALAAPGGEARDPGEREGRGAVGALLRGAEETARDEFLDKRAPRGKKGRRAFALSDRYRAVADDERARVEVALADAVARLGPRHERSPDYYRVLDVAGRVAGLGSLGVGRYAILVEGRAAEKGGANAILELKEARSASPARARPCPALRAFADEAARVVEGQVALRGERAPDLGVAAIDGAPYYLRRLSHREQRVDLETLGASAATLGPILDAEALALARAHVRSRVALGLAGPLEPPGERERAAWLALAARLTGALEADLLVFAASPSKETP